MNDTYILAEASVCQTETSAPILRWFGASGTSIKPFIPSNGYKCLYVCVCVCVWAGPHRIAHGHEFWLAHSADGAGQSVTASDQRGGCHTERCVQLACRWVCDGDGGEGYHERSGRSEDGTGQCGECRCRVVRPAQRGDGDLHIIVRRRRGLNRSPAPAPAPRTGRRTAAAP
jgi:hypothetical protein